MSNPMNRPRLVLGLTGLGTLTLVSLLILSCSQGEEFKYVKIERDTTPVVEPENRKADMSVIFTGSTKGEFEPCGCGGVHEGGFARRSTVIETIRRANPNLLLLDTGDTTSSGSPSQTEFIDQAYSHLHYDAIAVGEGDLRVGMDDFNKYARAYSLPFVASNLKFKKPTPIREVVVVRKNGKQFAIISLISDRWLAILPMAMRDEFTYETPIATLRRLVPKIRGRYDAVILLSHLGPSLREPISKELSGVDLWIDTGGHQSLYRPGTQPALTNAKSVNAMSFFVNRTPPLFVSWQNDRKIGVAGIKWSGDRITVPVMDMIPLAKSMVEDKQYLDIYDAYRYVSRQEMIKRIMNPTYPTTNPTTKPAAFGFVPSEKCGTCHQEIYQFWKSTEHAHAFNTLKKGNRDSDVNCWSCHTTGFREDGGFDNPVSNSTLVNVGCQDCHRKDLKSHPKPNTPEVKPAVNSPMAQFQEGIDNLTKSWHCQRCHVPHRSPAYEYKSYLKRISCSQALKDDQNTDKPSSN